MAVRGARRHRITIQSPPTTEDDFGQQSGSWVDVLTRIPARVLDETERQFFAALQVKSDKGMSVTFRHPGIEIKTSHRVLFHDGLLGTDRVLDITAVLQADHTGGDIKLLCLEHK